MENNTYFQYTTDIGCCSKILVTDASESVLTEILAGIEKDNKLGIGEQEEAIQNILKIRGYTCTVIAQKFLRLKNPK